MTLFWSMWFKFVMAATSLLPDVKHTMQLRGYLAGPALDSCGKNFQLACDVRIAHIQKLTVGDDVYFSGGVWILAGDPVVIEDQVMLGPYSVVISGDHSRVGGSWRFGAALREPILIKRGAWVGAHGVVTKGVTIGAGSCVAAGGVVTEDIPDDVIAGGVPARVLRRI